ncbi:MAG TPA: serine/threonine-protein kinase [Geminicoccaceae bacterium]|nr:serine/threonine-protein kinase [Geminicoccaceae bacterium]
MDTEATRIGGAGGGQLAVGAVLAHTYEIVRFIRAGGMGEVYEARHLVDGSRLAVKVIRPDLVGDERIRAMFVREAGILRRIRDEAVVGYEGLLQDEQGRSFLVMGFIDGPSLAERAQSRPLSTEEAMRLLDRLARGLAAVHVEGTFHRDLSPDNILLPAGDLDRAVIIDFGIAKLAEPQAGTLVGGDIAGKASYMSPEQLGVIRQEVDARSDIYSLALTIAAAVRGRALNAGASWAEVVEARRRVPDLEGIGEPLRSRLAHMLQPDPADRPQSMAEVLEAPRASGRATRRARGAPAAGPVPGGRAGARRGAPVPLLPVAGGVAGLVVLAGLGWLFFGPRADLDEAPVEVETVALPPETEAAPEQPQEAPVVDVAALERAANAALAALPCSQLSARVGDDRLASVSGLVSLPGDLTRVTQALQSVDGLGGVDTAGVLTELRPVCSAAALVDAAARPGGLALSTNHADGVFRDGDYLVVHTTVPPGPPLHVYVDYVDPGGDVVHLRPNPVAPETMIDGGSALRMGVEAPDAADGARHYQLGAPYGQAVVIVLASAAPLFSGLREEVEPAASYLPALEQSLAAQAGEVQGSWQYLEIVAGE